MIKKKNNNNNKMNLKKKITSVDAISLPIDDTVSSSMAVGRCPIIPSIQRYLLHFLQANVLCRMGQSVKVKDAGIVKGQVAMSAHPLLLTSDPSTPPAVERLNGLTRRAGQLLGVLFQ
jgi:hypothetical protein